MRHATYDLIIAGGQFIVGPAVFPTLIHSHSRTILVIEAGPTTRDDPLHVQPARYLYHLRPDSTTVKFQVGRESAALGGRAPVVPCGQCLGGGSSVNFTMYTRASASDYDDWANVYGNKGWSSADLLPLLRKCETYQVQPGLPTHGYSGPLKVSYGGLYTEAGQEFLEVAAQYDKTRGHTDDPNGLYECNKYSRWPKWIDVKTGTRSDVPHHYIFNQELKNVHILTGYHVKKVIFDGKRATGVQYLANTRFHPGSKPEICTATARRLVVVSAGAFGSPAILERSGIGSKELLRRLGIDQVVELPGVGENYQDHQIIFTPYLAAETSHTLDPIVNDHKAEIEKWTKQWQANGSGLLANNGLDAGIKLRPFKKDLDMIGQDFRKRWLQYYAPAPDKPVLWLGTVSLFLGDRSTVSVDKSFTIAWYLQHPVSVGHVHIRSRDDVESPLDFHPGYGDAPEDVALHKWGYKRGREFARRLPSYRGEIAACHPAFAPTSKAAVGKRTSPVPVTEPDIEYSAEDDRVLEEYIRQMVGTTWHSMGTCAMKKRAEGGVVDSRLNVYGVEGLKVIDLSICPGNVAANTYSTAVVIGEKGAIIVAEDLGIPLESQEPAPVLKARL
ncbi:alcohol oxidase-like protein [Trametes cingulata]|nr:alcohol oxidase-like protein [Trametes cingulata]